MRSAVDHRYGQKVSEVDPVSFRITNGRIRGESEKGRLTHIVI